MMTCNDDNDICIDDDEQIQNWKKKPDITKEFPAGEKQQDVEQGEGERKTKARAALTTQAATRLYSVSARSGGRDARKR